MDVQKPNLPSPSGAAVPMDTSDPAAPVAATPAASPAALSAAIASIEKEHAKAADAILKHLLKLLTALKKNPNLLANRKYRCDNIAIKKFVVDVTGALEVMKIVGYQQVELTDKKTPYLVIEEAALAGDAKARLDLAIDAVQAKVTEYERAASGAGSSASAKSAAAPAEPKNCLGGCGFFGSADTEGYCSQCFKKKFLSGASGATSPNKPPPKHNDPFVTPPKAGAAQAAVSTASRPAAAASSSAGASLSLGGGSSTTEQKCLKHCGRFGSSAYKGFCKECYERITSQGLKPPPKRWKCLFDGAMVKVRAIVRFAKGKKPVQENKSRCWVCSKKIGITGFECRCRYVFCAQHRYMEQHDCSYDIKSLHRKKLKKENEEIRAAKIDRL